MYKHYICDVLNTPFNQCVIIMSLRRVIYLFNLIRWHTGTIEKPKTRFAEKQMCDAWNARRFAYKMILSLWVYMLVMIPNNNYPNTLRIIRVSFHQNSKTEKYRKYFFEVIHFLISCCWSVYLLRWSSVDAETMQ